jgi:2-oxoglutarate ferredoxin oxidoreductase subunit alpha
MKPYMSRHIDVLISLNDKNILPNLGDLSDGGTIIASKKWIDLAEKTITDIRTRYTVYDPEITDKYENTYLLGILAGLTWVGPSPFIPAIEKSFKRKWEEIVSKNLEILAEYSFKHSNTKNEKLFAPLDGKIWSWLIYGNKALSYGAIESGLDFFSAYPMTPASTVLSEIVNSKRVTYIQAEDEIAVMNSTRSIIYWGSCYGRNKWWGICSHDWRTLIRCPSRIPDCCGSLSACLTIDRNSNLFWTEWDSLCTGSDFWWLWSCRTLSIDDGRGYYMAGQALNIAQKYQTTVIILTDKQFQKGRWQYLQNLSLLQWIVENSSRIQWRI